MLLNEKLTTELRPTLFLAQLSNLLAGNISIVHKVTGSSRTFMGEEGAGVSAIETAAARIRAGQSTHRAGRRRVPRPNIPTCCSATNSAAICIAAPWTAGLAARKARRRRRRHRLRRGAFLVLESREHAEARGRTVYARLGPVASDRGRAGDGIDLAPGSTLARRDRHADRRGLLVISGASGAPRARPPTKRPALGALADDRRARVRRRHRPSARKRSFRSRWRWPRSPLARRRPIRPSTQPVESRFAAHAARSVLAIAIGYQRGRRHGARLSTEREGQHVMSQHARTISARPIVAVTGIGVVSSLGVARRTTGRR